jgi:uncharacterized protein YhaN
MRYSTITVLVAALLVTSSGVVVAQSSGHKKTDKLIYRAQQTTSAIRAANLQVRKTLESYNYIVEGKAQDPRAEYKKLVKDIGKSQKAREDVRTKAEAMQKAADAFFQDWQESLAGYNSDEMRAKSEDRMNTTRANYDKIFEAGARAGEEFETFIAALDDQVRYLGIDLNPTAIAGLTDEAAELNEQADAFFAAIDDTIQEAVSYSSSLAPE